MRHETTKRKVFVVDDHPIVRQGLTLLINREPDLAVCGDAEEAQSALRTIEALKPDILIVDISLNGPDGLDLLKTIRAKDPGLPVLILSMHDESIYAERALRAGANGYIMKQEATERVLVALRRILNGEIYVSDRMATRCCSNMWAATSPAAALASRRADRPGTGSVPPDRRRPRHPPDRRRVAPQRQDRRVLPGSHQRKTRLKNSRELIQCAIQSAHSRKSRPVTGTTGYRRKRRHFPCTTTWGRRFRLPTVTSE